MQIYIFHIDLKKMTDYLVYNDTLQIYILHVELVSIIPLNLPLVTKTYQEPYRPA
jgi:hypothetical protein